MAYKATDIESVLKAIQGMRKALAEAHRQAIMASDEIDNVRIMQGNDDFAVDSFNNVDVELALQSCETAVDSVRTALDASDDARAALRNGGYIVSQKEDSSLEARRRAARERQRRSMF